MIDFNIVIPSRYASTRLPGKPLIDILGKTMLEHVWINAKKSQAKEVIIATDDERIASKANQFGASVCMTNKGHQSGTERITEVINRLKWKDEQIVLNVQGDEPLMPHTAMNECALLLNEDLIDIGTLGSPFLSKEDWLDPNMVKVLVDCNECALYFSRSSIPYPREGEADIIKNNIVLHHHGIYAYKCKSLRALAILEDSQIQIIEGLEQLKAIYHGLKIKVGVTCDRPGVSVDVPEDVDLVIKALK
ncbi:3-deoxy-manno-octulosonate cytidylyltransferase [Woeseiaceae bacterium]|jgi:3-deoxy-manno-octulosonate cytidylyltransferase (CMP-KDO synthetase)|nr:3-deoxy-manno-octulosonate cytidylyltransferase [Woeseiaceae bacterium]